MQRIGVIGGLGWMAQAMIQPALENNALTPEQLLLSSRRKDLKCPLSENIRVLTDNQTLVDQVDCVVLAIKPEDFLALQVDLKGKLVLSIMAGVSMQTIEEHTGATHVIRAMPNAAAELGESCTGYVASESCTQEELEQAIAFMQPSGMLVPLNNESELNAFTAFIGSGHGWMAYFADSIIQSMQRYGFDGDLSQQSVRQLCRGAGMLVAQEEESPSDTVNKMTTYAGTTAAGLVAMSEYGIAESIHESLIASLEKANSNMTQ